jgi:methionine-rich copper-binding protein CopC
MRAIPLLFSLALLPACASGQSEGTNNVPQSTVQSLLASSRPADGALVAAPIDELEFNFARPARLAEVTVTGSDGSKMPIMVNAVGEVTHYSLPIDGLGAGRYTADWRASSAGIDYHGNIHFDVK